MDEVLGPKARLVRELARSLGEMTVEFEQLAKTIPRVFAEYRKLRTAYYEVQARIFTIQDKSQERGVEVPPDLHSWLIRNRLRVIAAFARVSLEFFRNPPRLLVQAMGAYEVLSQERDAFTKILPHYDMMLMEAAVDDKTADELDQVRIAMEEVIVLLDGLLQNAPPQLRVF